MKNNKKQQQKKLQTKTTTKKKQIKKDPNQTKTNPPAMSDVDILNCRQEMNIISSKNTVT